VIGARRAPGGAALSLRRARPPCRRGLVSALARFQARAFAAAPGPRSLALALALAVCAAATVRAQDEPRTIPRAIFVGDRATLIVPLSGFPDGGPAVVELPAYRLPSAPDIDIHRVALERWPGGVRLAVEFAAFAPGALELPPIEIAGEVFRGLVVEVNSALAPREVPVLSPPLGALAVPGTALLVYGTAAALALALLLLSLATRRGRALLARLLASLARRRVFWAMLGAERRLRKALAKGAAPREVLDGLSRDFRGFLADLAGESCRAMTAAELADMPLIAASDPAPAEPGDLALAARMPSAPSPVPGLGAFVARCDRARFGGRPVDAEQAEEMLGEMRAIVLGLRGARLCSPSRALSPAAEAERGKAA